MALVVGTWLWGDKYGRHYVERLAAGLARHLVQDYRFMVFRPMEMDEYLTKLPGCFARLRMFDPMWQAVHGIKGGDRLVCIDLDVVVTGPLDALFDRPEDFCILRGVNSSNPCPYNGSLWMLRAGFGRHVWRDFSPTAAARVPFHEFPDDQAWFAHKLPGAAGWGPRDGVYGFRKPGWPRDDRLPPHARLVAFPGRADPSQFEGMGWVRDNWRV